MRRPSKLFSFFFVIAAVASGWDREARADSAADKLLHEINLSLQETNGKAQTRRMLVVGQKALQNLPRIDVAAGLRRNEINKLVTDLIERANSTDDFHKQNITLLDGAITPGSQKLAVTLLLRKTFSEAEIELQATGNAAVSAFQDTIFFGVYLDHLRVTKVRITRERFDVSAAAPIISTVVDGLLGPLNIVLDREINKKEGLGARILLPPLFVGDLAKSNTATLKIKSREVDIFATISQAAALVADDGIVLLAAVENKKADPVATKLPEIDDPTSMSDQEVTKAIAEYQAQFNKRLKDAFGTDLPDLKKQSFVLVSRQYAAKTLNDALKPPAICATGRVSGAQPPFSSPITMPAPAQRQCEDVVNGCRFKDQCKDADACKETVDETVHTTCDVLEKVFDPLGIASMVTHQKPCDIIRKVTQDIDSPACNAFRETRRIHPVFCNTASNIVKAKCDTIVAGDKAFCQGEETLRGFIAANPVAVVDGTITPDVSFDTCVSASSLDQNASTFSATVEGKASGSLSVHLAFQNKTPPGVGLCAADWAQDFSFNASTVIPPTQLSFAISGERSGDGLDLVFNAGDQDFKADFSPSPIDTLFGKHPQLLVNCSVAAGIAAGFITYDTAINEKMKNLSPLLTGKGYKLTAKDVKFKLNVPPLDVKDVRGVVLFSLIPNWRAHTIAFLK